MASKFKQGGDWHVRRPDGSAVNLNTPQGAQYVLELQARLIESQQKTSRPRRKAGPRENKNG